MNQKKTCKNCGEKFLALCRYCNDVHDKYCCECEKKRMIGVKQMTPIDDEKRKILDDYERTKSELLALEKISQQANDEPFNIVKIFGDATNIFVKLSKYLKNISQIEQKKEIEEKIKMKILYLFAKLGMRIFGQHLTLTKSQIKCINNLIQELHEYSASLSKPLMSVYQKILYHQLEMKKSKRIV